MKIEEIREIMDCLPKGRTKFYYFKDRYALMLLSYAVGEGMRIRDIKNSRFARLIHKPVVEQIIKDNGCGRLTPAALGGIWPETYHCYLLTLGIWGSSKGWSRFYNQTSRPGWNLVLHLNFAAAHQRSFYRLVKPSDPYVFQCLSHPAALDGRHTLAWARIDMDLESGEALIEEIQTDWIRKARQSRAIVGALEKRGSNRGVYVPQYVRSLGCDAAALSRYLDHTLKPHMQVWDEAMLASTIWFLKEEIGIEHIYYHTFEFGSQWKRISGRKPPRSLYTRLPDRFCFRRTRRVPGFLRYKNNRVRDPLIKGGHRQFYLLEPAPFISGQSSGN